MKTHGKNGAKLHTSTSAENGLNYKTTIFAGMAQCAEIGEEMPGG